MSIERIENLERELETIRERNARVEAEKAWEVSTFRICCICVITYFAAAAVLSFIGVQKYWLNALMPTLGFFLSAQSLPFIKRAWVKKKYRKGSEFGY